MSSDDKSPAHDPHDDETSFAGVHDDSVRATTNPAAAPATDESRRPTLTESWADFARRADDDSIHSAVSDALAERLPRGSAPAGDDDELPPPPDRSGSRFHTWSAEDDRPEFAHHVVSGDPGSSAQWPIPPPSPFPVDALADEAIEIGLPHDEGDDEPAEPAEPTAPAEPAEPAAPAAPEPRPSERPVSLPSPLRRFSQGDDEALVLAPIQVADVPDDDDDDELLGLAPRRDLPRETADPEGIPATSPATSPAPSTTPSAPAASASSASRATPAPASEPDVLEITLVPAAGASIPVDLAEASAPAPEPEPEALTEAAESPEPDGAPEARSWRHDDADPGPEYFEEPFPEEDWRLPEGLVGLEIAGRYRLLRPLSRGQSARVYVAEELATGRELALKVIGVDHPAQEERARLFRREARAMARLSHPGIVPIIDVGVTPSGLSYMAMEFLQGETLADLLAREGRLAWRRAVDLARQVMDVTRAVHQSGHIHRTIQPDKCFLVAGADERLVLIDVGVTAFTAHYRRPDGGVAVMSEGLMGSAEYMAPEVVSGHLPDARSDIYALGILLFELITGAPPFDADSLIGLLKRHLYDEPPPPRSVVEESDLPEPVEAVILAALAKDPSARPASIDAFVDALAGAEARQSEVVRAKTLLVAIDASMWGEDAVALAASMTQETGPKEQPAERPIAPLTDEDRPADAPRPAPARPVPVAPPKPAAPVAAAPPAASTQPLAPLAAPPVDAANPTRTALILVGLVALVLLLLITLRPGPRVDGPQVAAKTPATKSSPAPRPPVPEPAPRVEARPQPPPQPPPPEVVPLDPSEGAPLDPSEGAPLDPSEGAPDTAPDTGAASPPDKPDVPAKPDKPAKPSADLDAATIRARVGALRSRVSSQCGQSGGLFAPVGLTVKLRVDVDSNGRVRATPSGPAAGTNLARCAVGIVETLRFPASPSGGSIVHTFKL